MTITAYKGFREDLKCRDLQYEVGKEACIEGELIPCTNGLHACFNPLDVFFFYRPGEIGTLADRYGLVHLTGNIKESNREKVVTNSLVVVKELSMVDMLTDAVSYIKEIAHGTLKAPDFSKYKDYCYSSAYRGREHNWTSRKHSAFTHSDVTYANNGNRNRTVLTGDGCYNASAGHGSANYTTGREAYNASAGDQVFNLHTGVGVRNVSAGRLVHNVLQGDIAESASVGVETNHTLTGHRTRCATTGNVDHILATGDGAHITRLGNYGSIEVTGKDSVITSHGRAVKYKAAKGTYISVALQEKCSDTLSGWRCVGFLTGRVGYDDDLPADKWLVVRRGKFIVLK